MDWYKVAEEIVSEFERLSVDNVGREDFVEAIANILKGYDDT